MTNLGDEMPKNQKPEKITEAIWLDDILPKLLARFKIISVVSNQPSKQPREKKSDNNLKVVR
jgi:hypothetical protein